MRIGLDLRLYGLEHAGIGRYTKKIAEQIIKKDKKNTYVLFVSPKHEKDFLSYKNVETRVVDIPIYSFTEQLIFPLILNSAKLDLLHVPHFNAPLLYGGKLILTVHDLIKDYSVGKNTTTRSPFLYFLRRLGYIIQTRLIVKKAIHIIVPTEYVKKDLIARLQVPENKITATHEAVDSEITEVSLSDEDKKEILHKYNLSQPFLIYTGSVYPHKNVETLIEAVIRHNYQKEFDLILGIACARSVFYERLEKLIKVKNAENQTKLLGFVSDKDLSKLYSLALALVHPSRHEGFGLTGLEAMKVGLPVISSNASCLPEVYGDAALYFNPDNVSDLQEKIEIFLQNPDLRSDLASRGYLRERQFSWDKTARETLAIYKKELIRN